jgi:hypothetical protein
MVRLEPEPLLLPAGEYNRIYCLRRPSARLPEDQVQGLIVAVATAPAYAPPTRLAMAFADLAEQLYGADSVDDPRRPRYRPRRL